MRRRQRGVALVIVLWISMLLALLAGSYVFAVHTETRVTTGIRDRAEARALAEGAVNYVCEVMLLTTQPEERPFRLNGEPHVWTFAGHEVKVRAGEAAGRIDINNAQEDLLSLALQAAGVPDEQAVSVVDAVLDWRDSDDARRVNGAERDDYTAAGVSPGPRDANFDSVDELGQVLGIDTDLVERLRPMVTVHGSGGIDPRYVPRELLLGLTGGDEALVDALIAGDNADVTQKIAWDGFVTGETNTLHVDIDVPFSSGSHYRFSAVVSPDNSESPCPIVEWRE